jgi:hypothetical protein
VIASLLPTACCQVEQDVAREPVGFVAAFGPVELAHQAEELDRQRGRAHQDVALAEDLDRAARRIVAALRGSRSTPRVGVGEQRFEFLGTPHCLQTHGSLPAASCRTIQSAPARVASNYARGLVGSARKIAFL